MKKKLIAIAIAAAVTAPLTAQAAATISGDAEFSMQNTDAVGWAGYNRVRVKVDADIGGGVSAHTRLRMNTGGDVEADTALNPATGAAYETSSVRTDYAYMTAKVGPAGLTMGDQLATWGTKIWIDSTLKNNRLVAAFKPSNTLTAKLIMDPYSDVDSKGAPQLSFAVVSKLSNMMTAGLLYFGAKDDAADTDAENNIFVKGQMSGVVFGVESMSTAADERVNYLMAGMKAGGANVALHYLDGKAPDSDWEPVGVINGDANLAGSAVDITVITADLKAGGMDVTVGVGQAAAAAGGDKESLIGLDLGKKLGAADFNFSYGSYDSESSYGFSFKTKF